MALRLGFVRHPLKFMEICKLWIFVKCPEIPAKFLQKFEKI